MNFEYNALITLIRGLNAVSLDLKIFKLLESALNLGSVSNAELIVYTAFKENKINNDDYNALMFMFEKCDDLKQN